MIFDITPKVDVSLYSSRLKDFTTTIKQEHKPKAPSVLLLFSNFEFENDLSPFVQDSSFFYLTGIEEPGVVLVRELDGDSTLYVPNYDEDRAQWMDIPVPFVQENAKKLGVTTIKPLGDQCSRHSFHPFFPQEQYKLLLERLANIVSAGGKIFTLSPNNEDEYVQQRFILERMKGFAPELTKAIVDISPIVASMRRIKDRHEIGQLYEAIGVTVIAHEEVAQSIEPGLSEREVQGALEYIFTVAGGTTAFPSVVASGKNGTVLHYTTNGAQLKEGDLVVVDIGARIGNYCADLTRTYPVSGRFTARQRELYDIVLQAQEYIAQEARPGMWLKNDEKEDKSLKHLAKKFLKARGLEQYFPHGIGHFLGLDVHDVGDVSRPLQEGDVFTIEPGVYIPEEQIGIRIEDDFWMAKDGAICLSEELPREADAIERLMKEKNEGSEDNSEPEDEILH